MTEMAAKKLEPGSEYAEYDTDGDGVVSDSELETSRQLKELKLSDDYGVSACHAGRGRASRG